MFSRLFGPPLAPATRAPQVSAAAVARRMQAGEKLTIIDVREPGEYAAGHIPGARLIPLREIVERMAELPRDRELIMVCRSGNRSGTAAEILAARGYQAANMAGGMLAWPGPIAR